ncbi:MAG TPA: class F sortase [Candidatus Paceibacterota bacterium]|nr:class F sortase [Candidatus Paceibacterota bacterium]
MWFSRFRFVLIVCVIVLTPLLPSLAVKQDVVSIAASQPINLSNLSLVSLQEVDAAMSTVATPPSTVKTPVSSGSKIVTTNNNVLEPNTPVRLIIPSIGINDAIDSVGLDKNGAMAVPSGKTNDVGWYEYGTVPGAIGSAVIDAHVFAAFSQLKNIAVGSNIYIQTAGGGTLHFQVEETDTYPLAEVPADTLFNRSDTARLNLITCAGNLIDNGETYDHRLVAYAVLVP